MRVDGRVCEACVNLGGEPAAALRGGGAVPTSISPARGRADRGVESSLERR